MHLNPFHKTTIWSLCYATLLALPLQALANPPAPPNRAALIENLQKWSTPAGARWLQLAKSGGTAEIPVPFRCTADPDNQKLQLEDLQILSQTCAADGKKCQYQIRLGLVQAQPQQHCQEAYALQLVLAPGKVLQAGNFVPAAEPFWQIVSAHSFSSYRYLLKPVKPLAPDALAKLQELLQQRLKLAGLKQSLVPVKQGSADVLVLNLPFPEKLPEALLQNLGQPAAVDFRISPDKQSWQATGLNKSHLKEVRLKRQPAVTTLGPELFSAGPGPEDKSKAVLEILFTASGKTLLAQLSQRYQGHYLGMFIDGQLVSAPYFSGLIPDGGAMIENLDQTVAQKLAILMPFPLLPISMQISGPVLVEEPAGTGLGTD